MSATIADVMTRDPACVDLSDAATEAARRMRDVDAGDVVVLDEGRVAGIVTDRDIAIRLVAEGRDLDTPVSEICSTDDIVTLAPQTDIGEAVQLMRERAVRRIPVVDGDRAVGIVSLGDLATRLDPTSVLADISDQPSNT